MYAVLAGLISAPATNKFITVFQVLSLLQPCYER